MGGIAITGIEETLFALKRLEKITNDAALKAVRKGGKKIQKLAREYAPVDVGNLEDAIIVQESRKGNQRYTIFVGVDPNRLGRGFIQYGFRYDIEMHEASYNLGEKSQAKNERVGGGVGNKYLSRALDDLEEEINDDVERAVSGVI